jgi:hypothetical protein
VDRGQQRLFTRLAQENRYFYVQATTLPSTNAASARTADLASFTDPLVERLLVVKLPSGVELSQVDIQDLEAELAPRFYPLGTKLVEVGNEWGASGVVTLSVWYVYRPVALDLEGALSQLITVPDRFADWLEIDLAIYMAGKDYGRAAADPQEMTRLVGERQEVYDDFLTHLDHLAGPSSRRFVLPTSSTEEKA